MLDLSISALRDGALEAVTDGNVAANAVIAALGELGLTSDAFRTTRIALSPEYDFFREGTRALVGFRYTNSLRVTLVGTDAVGPAIDAVVVAGGDLLTIEGISFERADRATIERTVRLSAIDDAIAKAQAMAERAGVTLGRAVRIVEGGGASPVSLNFADEVALATPVFAGTQDITVTVQMEFEIN